MANQIHLDGIVDIGKAMSVYRSPRDIVYIILRADFSTDADDVANAEVAGDQDLLVRQAWEIAVRLLVGLRSVGT